MKKSIFLIFAAILCAVSVQAEDLFLRGDFNSWGSGAAEKFTEGSGTVNVALSANTTYKFLVANSGWGTKYGTASFSADATKTLTKGGSDMTIKTTFNGTYAFTFDVSTKKLTVTYPKEEVPVETHDITIKAKYPAGWNAGKAAIHFWGTGVTGTTPAAMTQDGDWWTYTVTGVPTTSPLSVIFINGSTWNGDANQTVDITGITESTCFQVSQSGSAKGTAVKADCETGEGEVIETHDITVKAFYPASWNAGKAAVHFWGDGVTGATPAAMTKDGDWWTYTVTGVPTTTELSVIFINGNTWNGDANQTVDITGITESTCYQITSGSGKASAAVVDCASTPVVAEDVYTVVGSDNLFGSAWSPAAEANDMEKQDDGSYKKVYSNVELTSDVIWKIAKNDDWWNGPTFNANNNTLTIAKSGIYNVTFTLSADLKTATAEADLLEETNKVADCFISGNAALTGGAGWEGNEFKMEYNEATATYSYTFTALAAETEYLLKVVLGDWYGYEKLQTVPAGVENKEGNIAFTLAEAGDVTVTYNKDNGINITGNFAIPVTYDYYIAGTLAGGWSATQQGMESIDGVYKHTFTALAVGTYQFKVTNGKWSNEEGGFDCTTLGAAYEEVSIVEGNVQIVTEETKDITVIFDATNKNITFVGLTEKAPVEKHYYLIGTFNEWTLADANYELALVDGLYKKEVTLAKDAEFKVNQGDWDASWGKDNLGGKTYAELDFTNDGNLKMKEEKTFTVIFNLTENLITFEGLTEKAPAVVTYVLMGVNGDWTTGIPMTQKANEYVLTCQAIAATDAVKVVKCEDGAAVAWYGSVKDGVEVTVNYDANGNIQLPAGTYNFYFDSSLDDKQLWIEAATYTRDATPGSFSTICLPYAGTISGATLFDLSDRDENYVYVVEAGIELEAGKPYVILPTEDKITVTYKNYDYVDAGSYNALYGTYDEMNSEQLDGKYVITGDKYYYVDKALSAGSKLLANRAYFNLNELPEVAPVLPVGARRIALGTNGQNTATGMENVDASAQPVKTIINGQLFILRGEKMYDAQGKLVK